MFDRLVMYIYRLMVYSEPQGVCTGFDSGFFFFEISPSFLEEKLRESGIPSFSSPTSLDYILTLIYIAPFLSGGTSVFILCTSIS